MEYPIPRVEFMCWFSMLERCYCERNPAYKNYGGRGIGVCDRWHGLDGIKNFIEDMGMRPNAEYSLDRINNEQGYSKDNCRWATRKEQCRNRRTSLMLTINNVTKAMAEWAEISGVEYTVVKDRIAAGWPAQKAVFTPKRTAESIVVGERFGQWTVIAPTDRAKNSERRFLCGCECGNRSSVRANDLLLKKSTKCKQCGCKR